MSRFSQPRIGAADGFFVVTFPMSPSTLFDWHVHEDHQLAWASAGVLTVLTGGTTWVLPPSRALWIPAGLPFGRWRTLLRLQSALPLLASGEVVSRIAARVGYETAERVHRRLPPGDRHDPGRVLRPDPGYAGVIPRSPRPPCPGRFSGTTFTSECAAITR